MKHRIVPTLPTMAQLRAADERYATGHPHEDIYFAMVKAAPPYVPSEADIEAVARAMCWADGGDVCTVCKDQGQCSAAIEVLDDRNYVDMARAAASALLKRMGGHG